MITFEGFFKMESNITIGLRRNMIDELVGHLSGFGISHYEKVLQIMGQIPRHIFAPIGFERMAYEIAPVLIDEDQTMSSPLTVALQTIVLNPQPTDKILEIGTGSGYQASVLSFLCKEVYTLERHKILHEKSKSFFKEMKMKNVFPFLKDGFEGLAAQAPFDKIIITCGADFVPDTLLSQLKKGGEMIIPLNDSDTNYMKRIIKLNKNEYYEERFDGFQFVPMLKGINF
ncbi:MAG: protein-L-isoaspartate O-methyltransferase family protein [Chitinophagales bacterium]|jgi:protein-L-isoaspartate(D-aspartate) O-methyltransferase|nr:protein-L-isoaspartate O-methyltransferase [Sphingobacteriales bacterium]